MLRWIKDGLPPGCAAAGGEIGQPSASPYASEEGVIAKALAKRRHEFRAGRIQARRALALLGCAATEIPKGPAGEPVWPAGYVGSIGHTDDFAFAVAGGAGIRALALDVDSDAGLEDSMLRFVCRPGELQAVQTVGVTAIDPGKRLFVAKEAFMKLNYALTRTVLDFLDVEIRFRAEGPETHAFRATPFPAAAGTSRGYEGRLGWAGGGIAAIMYFRRADDV